MVPVAKSRALLITALGNKNVYNCINKLIIQKDLQPVTIYSSTPVTMPGLNI